LDQRARQPLGKRGEEQGEAKQRKQNQGCNTAELIGSHRPSAAYRRQTGNHCKSDRHTGQKRQTTLAEGLVGASKHKGQYGQNARAQNSEHASEIGQQHQ
jgi:hypothetical protein